MEFSVEKIVSNFISNQFPQFYKEEGDNFVLFMKAYYEWLESDGNPVFQARSLLDYRDIDNTLESFLEFFQKKYLYGIPFNVISNKRFLLKHILDIYRSKGTIQCYRLLFKLLYNEDIEIYLPGTDILRVSDGTWVEPKYLEISFDETLPTDLVGKTIVGVSSKTTATVENFVTESFNKDKINIFYVSNILPRGGSFKKGEKVTELGFEEDTLAVSNAPRILGSLDRIDVIYGGNNFNIGDVIKIAQRDISPDDPRISMGEVISYGSDGVLKVTNVSSGDGALVYDLRNGGFGFTSNSSVYIYKTSANGENAALSVSAISNTSSLVYNTDLICDYMSLQIDAATYDFPANTSANSTTPLNECLSYSNDTFGTIFTLEIINTGNNYFDAAEVFVRDSQLGSNGLPGTITYNNESNTVNGIGTIFTDVFSNNSVIGLVSEYTTFPDTLEYAIIKEVVSDTELTLYGPPGANSTANAQYRAAPTILPSQFAFYETPMLNENDSINGENEDITATPNFGNNIISEAISLNSGKGYVDGEIIKAYLHRAISNNILILNGGQNYTNGDLMFFSGGYPGTTANGFVTTDSNGSIVSANLTSKGSGYIEVPNIVVYSPSITSNTSVDSTSILCDSTLIRVDEKDTTKSGFGAVLEAQLEEFDITNSITARVSKEGLGKARGSWTTTRGFLNSDKYIQDSYYYQDYSYEIRVSKALSKYKDIIYETFHNTGSELFGVFLKFLFSSINTEVIEENVKKLSTYTVDSDTITVDSTSVTSDARTPYFYLLSSEIDFTSDNNLITVDKYLI